MALSENKGVTDIIQRNIEKGLPCGNNDFINKLETVAKNRYDINLRDDRLKKLKGSVPEQSPRNNQ